MPPNGRKHLRTLYSPSERWPFNLVMEATELGSPPPSPGSVTGGEEALAAGGVTAEPSSPEKGPKFRREEGETLDVGGGTLVHHFQAQAED